MTSTCPTGASAGTAAQPRLGHDGRYSREPQAPAPLDASEAFAGDTMSTGDDQGAQEPTPEPPPAREWLSTVEVKASQPPPDKRLEVPPAADE